MSNLIKEEAENYQVLFDFMADEYGLILVESEMQEIISRCQKVISNFSEHTENPLITKELLDSYEWVYVDRNNYYLSYESDEVNNICISLIASEPYNASVFAETSFDNALIGNLKTDNDLQKFAKTITGQELKKK